ncbi:MAG: peptidase M17 [Flavobacteriales bacterium]|nr:peptidase M17 [Flavobacteriales bacterium]|tara:strand:+ start:1552 stop:2934 length:1383 start_codon:yes stop_codon:yes gene_type:complete
MKFKVILYECVNSAKINWYLDGEFTLKFAIPINYIRDLEKGSIKYHDLFRREGAAIHTFLLCLNKSYHTSKKIKSISFEYYKKSHNISLIILDNFLEGFILSNYRFNKHKSHSSNNTFEIHTNIQNKINSAAISGTYLARDLVNQPLSHLNATMLSRELKKLAKEAGFSLKVLDENQIKKLKMGGVLGVNKGSLEKPTFNILTYKSKKSKSKNPVVLVGKGVMYDTGGLSLKPTLNSMDIMKCDMGGAAAVIGAIYSLAVSKANCYVIGLIPAVENRPGGAAYVPGDVITMMSGKRVEVLNTDAEGRLIMADALHYAKRYSPELVIDVATLTGAASRTIGKYGIVAMENHSKEFFGHFSENMQRLLDSGNFVGERIAVQPFWDDYHEELESSIADIKNIGGPEGGHITAGKFLEKFVDYPWIHLDIAGVTFFKSKYLYHSQGGTGVGVRLLTHFIASLGD